MTRKKVKLAYISNDSARKAAFKKRKKGLVKKVNELSTLCGVTACAAIYSPYDTNPEVWPSNSGVRSVFLEFKRLPETDQQKKMVDQEAFLKQRIAKAAEHLRRQKKENRELEMTERMFQCLNGNMDISHLSLVDLNDLGYLTEKYLKDVQHRLHNSGMEIGEPSSADLQAATTTPHNATLYEVGSSSSSAVVAPWFNPIQQQHYYHPAAPHVGVYEQTQNLSLSLNNNPNQNQQQWCMEMMNHPQQIRYPEQAPAPANRRDSPHNHNHNHQEEEHPNPIHGEPSTSRE